LSMEPVKYRIVDYRAMPSIKPDRRGLQDAMISYELEGGIRDNVTIPAEDATLELAKLAVEEHIRFKMQFIGATGEVAR